MKIIVFPILYEVQRFRVLIWSIWIFGILCIRSTGAARCRANRLPLGVTIAGACSFREKEMCRARCERNGTMLWIKPVVCLPNGRWSATPLCRSVARVTSMEVVDCRKIPVEVGRGLPTVCLKITESSPRPKCPEFLNVTANLENCSRETGTTCRVSCDDSGPATLRCLPGGRWSSVPSCVSLKPVICPEPRIVTLLNCSRREGETCKFRCPSGKVPDEGITCLSSGRWPNKTSAAFPLDLLLLRCPCPKPVVTKGLVALEDCGSKKVGERCKFDCRPKHLAMIGPKTATCSKNLTWTPLPRCSNKKCPAPQLTKPLIFKDNCSSKREGEECKLGCPGAFRLRENKIPFKCIDGTHWSTLPHCICAVPPALPVDAKFDEDCQRKNLGQTCKVSCKKGLSLTGSNFITCRNNGSWSAVPHCKRKGCISPRLPPTLRVKGNCSSKAIGEKCPLECTNESEKHEIVCLNNTQWSSYPKCSCPKPSLSKNAKLVENCMKKKPGEKCKVSCFGKDLFITCQNNTRWSHEPSCTKGLTCSLPQLPSYLQFDGDCSNKGDGEMCKLKCRSGSKFVKEGYIRCMKGKKWSDFPSCTCSKHNIHKDLELVGDCDFQKPGDSCKVRCKKLNPPITGSIICQKDTDWSLQPSCQSKYCQVPLLPPYLMMKNKCLNKTKGEVCEVSCKQKGSIVGQNFITCLDKLVWSPFPSCTCAEPKLGKNLIAKSECKGTTPGKKCELQCKKPFKLVGSSSIQCLKNSTWSAIPTCSADTICVVPKLPATIIPTEICSMKKPGDNCALKCKAEGEMLGNKFIKCLNATNWSKLPACACPKPTLKNGMTSVTDCSSELPGSKCHLKCPENQDMEGKDFITCQKDTKWSTLPKCSKTTCNEPVLKPFLVAASKCASKVPGQECTLQCREGGTLIGNPKIKCLNKTHWSQIPQCGCPPPVLDDDLKVQQGNCNQKNVGGKCNLKCKAPKELVGGKPYITCQRDLKWSSPPMCRVQTCTNPLTTSKILKPKDGNNCFDKAVNDTCTLECTEGGKVIGSETIRCLNKTHWSPLPDCACPQPDLPKYLKFDENCSKKKTGNTCKVSCNESKKLVGSGSLTCDKNKKWSPFPLCQTIFCPEPFIPRDILVEHPFSCASKQPGEFCNLICKEGGSIVGKSRIECQKNGSWSKEPDCTCPKPNLSDSLETPEPDGCSSKSRGQTCKVSCKNGQKATGPGFITCQNNTRWSPFPRCNDEFCSRPGLPSLLKSSGSCDSKRAGDTCDLICTNGGRVIGNNALKCLSNLTWSEHPKCTCPEVSLRSDLRALQNCSFMSPGKSCKIECADKLSSTTSNRILCSPQSKLSAQPTCRRAKCSIPTHLNKYVELGDDCKQLDSFTEGHVCSVHCQESSKLFNGSQIMCLRGNLWSESPVCSCKTPSGITRLHRLHSCEGVLPGHSCSVSCVRGKPRGTSMRCKENYSWDPVPDCLCPIPNFGPLYIIDEPDSCATKKLGTSCRVGCRFSAERFDVTCVLDRSKTWLNLRPCPSPRLCENPVPFMAHRKIFILSDICQKNATLLPGTTCDVRCMNEGAFFETRVPVMRLECWSDGQWNPDLWCSCPPVVPNEMIEVPTDCSNKRRNEVCDVVCRARLSGPLNARRFLCNGSDWLIENAEAPLCEVTEGACPDPGPELHAKGWVMAGNCETPGGSPHITAGSSCPIECKGKNGTLANSIHCLPSGSWSPIHQCACPTRTVGPPFRSGDCAGVVPGERCPIFCEPGFAMVGPGYDECVAPAGGLGDPIWRNIPASCNPAPPCPRPHISPLHKWTENCDSKFPEDTCIIECSENFVFHTFHSKAFPIKCNPDLTWVELPPCICHPFQDIPGIAIAQKCELLTPDRLCKVLCVRENQLVSVRCAQNGVWETPQCPQTRIGRNALPESLQRLPMERFLTKNKRHCDRPREIPFRSSCLHLSEALEGYRATGACQSLFRIRRPKPQRSLTIWFLKQRTPCVWLNDSFDKSKHYCIAMLSFTHYKSSIVECDAFQCSFVCEKKRSLATS